MIKKSILIFLIPVLCSTSFLQADDGDYHLGFRIAPRVSTLGGGLEVAKGLTPWFGLRGGVNYFTYDYNGKESDIEYDLNLELKSFGLFADVHPFKQAFRISAGFLINGNEFSGRGKITGTSFEIGDRTYNSSQVKSLGFDLSYNTFAPYLGIGFDTTFGDDDRWGFVFDLGILFSGSPEASFSYDDSGLNSSQQAILRGEVEKEKKEIQDSLDDFEFWPVLSAGLVYQF
jgi:hypothetical protein